MNTLRLPQLVGDTPRRLWHQCHVDYGDYVSWGDALKHVGSTSGGDGIPVVTRSIRPFHGMSFGKGQLWLDMFHINTPDSVQPPILLIFDGYKSHASEPAVLARAMKLNILLLCMGPTSLSHWTAH
ncbi:hypothetical protein DYB38_002072 [Aphanomyces astaci]|uniref:DDE-1 domain-containing protein n=1 Tax=Aphanomyces astaci TaxID=112090 RepID=A0A397CIK3_APHAT|nr:hypothetical protein DYB38_002072 [Aphanomyces astaci]